MGYQPDGLKILEHFVDKLSNSLFLAKQVLRNPNSNRVVRDVEIFRVQSAFNRLVREMDRILLEMREEDLDKHDVLGRCDAAYDEASYFLECCSYSRR